MAIVTTHVAAVQELYVAYFGRPADVAGLDYWTNVVEAQAGSTAAVSASFATQPEYVVAFFGKTNTQIVDQIYANMFGRAGSTTDGRSYWVNLLNAGTVGVSTIVAEVANGAQGADAEAVENKVAAATAFTTALDTPAEQTGYNGTTALNLAKAFITGITTDATLTNAIAPAALNATVAAVVKAGTPFSLESAVAASTAANEALGDFLEDNDLDGLATPALVAAELQGNVDAAAGAGAAVGIADFTFTAGTETVTITGFDTARPAVQTALLADAEADLAEILAGATTALQTARAAAGSANLAIVDNLVAADAALEDSTTAATQAQRVATGAELNVEALAGNRAVTVNYNVDANGVATTDVDTVTIVAAAGAANQNPITLIQENSAGNLVLASSSITETTYPGITALLNALRANQDAQLDLAAATEAQGDAQDEFDALGVGTPAGDAAAAVVTQTAAVAAAEEAIETLADLVADWEEAVALQTEYVALNDAVTAANATFTSNGYVAPKALDGTLAATSASDIFVLGAASVDAATITSFGRSGTDSIFLGTEFTLNTGDLEDGNNAAMEIFFVQNGTRAEIHVEKAAYGSASDDVTVITLVGVNADDLVFANGVVTVNTTA